MKKCTAVKVTVSDQVFADNKIHTLNRLWLLETQGILNSLNIFFGIYVYRLDEI